MAIAWKVVNFFLWNVKKMNVDFLSHGILIIVIVSGVPLLVSGIFSLILAFVQTITQIQEQSLSYLVKCMTIFIVFYFCLPYFKDLLFDFFYMAFEEVVKQGQL